MSDKHIEQLEHNHKDTIVRDAGQCPACDNVRDFWTGTLPIIKSVN